MIVFEKIEKYKIVPVVVIENADHALNLGLTLIEAGLPVIEITFRTKAAAESIAILSKHLPELLIGAGTILTTKQVDDATKAGAKFLVTPGFNPTVVDYCVSKSINIIPGLNVPSFVEWGMERGLKVFKFFPADLSGGPKWLKLISGPYPSARFMPTGGINNSSLKSYLELPNVIACGGSWIVKKDLISSKNYEEIKRIVKSALTTINM